MARGVSGPAAASTVAFAGVVANQLAQTLDVGWAEGRLSRSVLGAVAGSAGLLGAGLAVRPLRQMLGMGPLTPLGLALVGAGAGASVLLGRLFAAGRAVRDLSTLLKAAPSANGHGRLPVGPSIA